MNHLSTIIHNFFLSQRGSGTTTLLKNVAAKNDVWVLVPRAEMKSEFGSQGISFSELENMRGKGIKPILVDNFTMLKLCEEFDESIRRLEKIIIEKEKLIKKFTTNE